MKESIKNTLTKKEFLALYKNGQRKFTDMTLRDIDFSGELLEGVIFHKCWCMDSTFDHAKLRYAKFIDCNIKCCNFNYADLRDTVFDNVGFESASFYKILRTNLTFKNSSSYGAKIEQDDFDEAMKEYDEWYEMEEPFVTYTIDCRNINNFEDFIEAFNRDMIRSLGGEWTGILVAFSNYLSWEKVLPYKIVLLGTQRCREVLNFQKYPTHTLNLWQMLEKIFADNKEFVDVEFK